ncbi:hypothetical protein [Planotetraspora sp. GP83]
MIPTIDDDTSVVAGRLRLLRRTEPRKVLIGRAPPAKPGVPVTSRG